ncbi:MAG: PAS domain-containing protein [Acidobacteria bacterium]|nr:PAS domain-containing protein [Acidobacteriota bacterium]
MQAEKSQAQEKHLQLLSRLLESSPASLLLWAGCVTIVIVALDAWIQTNLSIGALYIIPMLLASPVMARGQVLVLALVCSVLREYFSPFGWEAESLARIFYTWVSFSGAGLFASEVARSQRLSIRHAAEMREQMEMRREAESQLRTLIESSPAAIITLDSAGCVDLANQAAHEMLHLHAGELYGRNIKEYLPVMADLLTDSDDELPYRTATNCRGRRAGGESFLACVWFATYQTRAGRRLAAIITDSSDDLRDWQETSLQSLLRSTRVLVGSVSHEIRNVCAAISVVHANLGRIAGVAETEDYAALGTLAQGLARLATVELHSSGEQEMGTVSLETLLEEFRIVVGPTLEANDITLSIEAPAELPVVLGDQHGLLQALLNLSRNSVRAMEHSDRRHIHIAVSDEDAAVVIRMQDSGPGVGLPERLFQPFQQGADAVGLGLFVSRAIVRACEGELYHEPSATGCTMCLRLKTYVPGESPGEWQNTEISA